MNQRTGQRGFSLIELVIVVVIIAIIAAIAIPKMSRGSTGAGEAALTQDLSVLREAMDQFNAEHPTASLGSVATTGSAVVQCLTQCSDATATNFSTTTGGSVIYGPYIRAIPALSVGSFKGDNTISVGPTAGTGPSGWLFTGTDFLCNDPSTDLDSNSQPYNQY